ncbi:MAG TPA: ATP-binding protein [Planctomycetes bacterium]|nr:ATP-binding protein [Planctomycetota bacterium]
MVLVSDEARSLHIAIGRDMADVGRANRSLEEFLESRAVDAQATFAATVVLEEILTNILKYAYEDGGPHEVRIGAEIDARELVLQIADDGRPFDILAAPAPDFDRPVECRDAGGLGIHLVRALAQRVEYRRAGGRNVVTVHFPLK